MHKSTFVKLAAAALVASAFSLPASAADVIKLGVAGPHSGDLAPYGLPSKDAAEMVVAEVNATGGIKVSNTSHNGQILILYFYPKDNTPGCTTEAMQFRDKYKDFVKAGATVFGVSRDNMKSHDEFKAKLELPFELIADTEEKMCHMFGVVKNKIMYGKKVKGIERSTFLIGPDGLLLQEWRGLKVPGHVDEVLKAVKSIKALKKAA